MAIPYHSDAAVANLHGKTGQNIISLLHDLARSENTTIVAATHDLSIEEQCDQIFRVRDGQFVNGAKPSLAG